MTEEFFASVAGRRCTSVRLYVPQSGAWFVDAILDESAGDLTGRVSVILGTRSMSGTVVPAYSGSFVEQRSVRIVAGANGWGKHVPSKAYHSESGVKARTIALDAAREVGETLGSFDVVSDIGRIDYVRRAGWASTVLDNLLGDRIWWVDPDGTTRGGVRENVAARSGSYNVLTYSPLNRQANIALDDPIDLWVGMTISDRLADPQTIREI